MGLGHIWKIRCINTQDAGICGHLCSHLLGPQFMVHVEMFNSFWLGQASSFGQLPDDECTGLADSLLEAFKESARFCEDCWWFLDHAECKWLTTTVRNFLIAFFWCSTLGATWNSLITIWHPFWLLKVQRCVLPSRKRSHIPPLEKENHLPDYHWRGYVSFQEGIIHASRLCAINLLAFHWQHFSSRAGGRKLQIPLHRPRWECGSWDGHLSNEKRAPGCFRGFVGDENIPSYVRD